jgi:hypothetical protein
MSLQYDIISLLRIELLALGNGGLGFVKPLAQPSIPVCLDGRREHLGHVVAKDAHVFQPSGQGEQV